MPQLLLINKLFYPVVGGVETVVAQIAKGVASDPAYQVSLLAGNEKASLSTNHYKWNEVDIYKAPGFGTIYNTALSFQYPYLLKRLIEEHEILHFHTPNPLSELSLLLTRIPSHKKVIVTVHADVSQTRRSKYGKLYNSLLKKLLQRADVITTMSPQNLDGFPVLQPFRSKCIIIPNAYNESHVQRVSAAEQNAFAKKFNLTPGKNIILFIGRLSKYKGLQYLIEAMKEMPGTLLLIVGDGEYKNALQEQSATAGVHAVFTGFLKGNEIACAYQSADVFALPSLTETFGIVQAEAMCFGLPVINTQLNTGVNFVSIHNDTGLTVPPANSQALRQAIETLLNDDDLRKRFSTAANERSAMFSPELMVNRFKEIYNQ